MAPGEDRFRMLATIRDYALELLAASGESAEMARRHAGYYCALVEQAEPLLRGGSRWPGSRGWLASTAMCAPPYAGHSRLAR